MSLPCLSKGDKQCPWARQWLILIGQPPSNFTHWRKQFHMKQIVLHSTFLQKRNVSNAMLKPIVLIVCAGCFIRNTEPYFNRWIKRFHMKQWALSSLESILFHMKQTIEFCPGLFLLSIKKPEKHICSSGRLMVIINH